MTTLRVAQIIEALHDAGLLVATNGPLPATLTGLADDSRLVREGFGFIAVPGHVADGHDFLDHATRHGMGLAIVERFAGLHIPHLVVSDARRAAAIAADAAWGYPSRQLQMIGVTGTSGKTTTVAMIRHLLDAPGSSSASIGTLGVLVGSAGEVLPGGGGLTTPGPVELPAVLRTLVARGVRSVAMETSSHALDQHRVDALRFDAGVFTNLSRDHLDYHGSMEAYLASKARLLTLLAPDGTAVVNADAPEWTALPTAPRTLRVGLRSRDADLLARDVRYGPSGTRCTFVYEGATAEVTLPLIGDFNVANALGAVGAALAAGMDLGALADRLATLPQVPGRLERILDAPTVLRDYAHKPDALERALAAVRPFTPGKLIVVFGCGGDRDRGKRPIMGGIAVRQADHVIVTSDNPRTEDPERILDDIEAGMEGHAHERIEDRREAIARALSIAQQGDVVMLAGKGHETYQIRGSEKLPFDEAAIVRELAPR